MYKQTFTVYSSSVATQLLSVEPAKKITLKIALTKYSKIKKKYTWSSVMPER